MPKGIPNRPWKNVWFGRGTTLARRAMNPKTKECEGCGSRLFLYERQDDKRKFYAYKREDGEMYAHKIFCEKHGVLAKNSVLAKA